MAGERVSRVATGTTTGRRGADSSRWTGFALCLPLIVFLVAAFLLPLVHLVPESLTASPGVLGRSLEAPAEAGPTLDNYRRALAGDGLVALRNSLVLSVAVSVVALVLCLPPAWVLARHRFRGRSLLRTVLALPLTFSGVIVGFLAILVLGRVGLVPAVADLLLGRPLLSGSAYTLGGLAAAYVYFEVPRATLTLEAAFRRLDPELERAAATLGASALGRLTRVVLPQVWPALVSTLAIAFAASMGSFGVALVLARRLEIVPLAIYTEFTGFLDFGYAAALSLVLAAVGLVAAGVLRLFAKEEGWIVG